MVMKITVPLCISAAAAGVGVFVIVRLLRQSRQSSSPQGCGPRGQGNAKPETSYLPNQGKVLSSSEINGGKVFAVCKSETHSFSKPVQPCIRLIAGLGVEGDAHKGTTVQHLSRIKKDPTVPNLRQVHLIHKELHDEVKAKGFDIGPGSIGENIVTQGLDILHLPQGTKLRIGKEAIIVVTGLRNPCTQIEKFQPGLLDAVRVFNGDGTITRKSGIMATVERGGDVYPGDDIKVEFPPPPLVPLQTV
jgi:hypothetical protein